MMKIYMMKNKEMTLEEFKSYYKEYVKNLINEVYYDQL